MKDVETGAQPEFPIRRVEILNWVLAGVLSIGAWFYFPFYIVRSIFIGALLANVSYLFLKKDLKHFLQGKLLLSGKVKMAKAQFYIKYYIRLTALGLILYFLVRKQVAHPLGLLIGLSTVVFSIGITAASVVKKFYFTAKEA
ncbi:MAG: ATP synthase subunit I [Deltaproteobacteria bacterium]|nr:ATP synthase subunit I [Deltaproteobacteria bacterium]